MNSDKIQEKLKQFEDEIRAKVQAEQNKAMQEVNSFKQAEMEKYTDTALADAYEIIQKEVSQQQAVLNKASSEKTVELKKELFHRREEYTNQIFDEVRKKIEDFTASKEYLHFLEKTASELGENTPSMKENVLLVKESDLLMQEEIKKAFKKPCTIQQDEQITLGGLILENSKIGYVEDRSLDNALEEQRKWFCDHSGMTVDFGV